MKIEKATTKIKLDPTEKAIVKLAFDVIHDIWYNLDDDDKFVWGGAWDREDFYKCAVILQGLYQSNKVEEKESLK